MKRSLATVFVCLLLATSACTSVQDEGFSALKRGDYTTALNKFRPLAERGDDRSQFVVGLMYAKGQGVTEDYAEAAKWYKKAAEAGFVKAQINLGILYEWGRGVSQDYVAAHLWYRMAATPRGNSDREARAEAHRDRVVRKMTTVQIQETEKPPRDWREWCKLHLGPFELGRCPYD